MLIALIVFALAYGLIASEKFPRHWIALIGGGTLIVLGVLTPLEALTYINWETLGLLAACPSLKGSQVERAAVFVSTRFCPKS